MGGGLMFSVGKAKWETEGYRGEDRQTPVAKGRMDKDGGG
jgi:hypothetical protein